MQLCALAQNDNSIVSPIVIYIMYKKTTTSRLEKSKRPLRWLKRKMLLIITAFMIGLSNGMYEEENSVLGNQHTIEQIEDEED